jgi:hypothetical protein
MTEKKVAHLRQNKYFNIGFIVLALICLVFMLAEIYNHRFWLSDLEVYYKSAYRILHGQNLYGIAEDGHYVFKYSPTSGLLFLPFLIVPFAAAKVVYWILLTSLIVAGFYLSILLIKPNAISQGKVKTVNSAALAATLILALHFLRELHLGQVNYLLLFLYLWAIYLQNKGREWAFSIILAVTVFIKPFGLIFLPYLIYKKKFKELLIFAGTVVILFLLPVLFYGSVATTLQQYQLWMNELSIELSHKQGLLESANHSIFSVLARYSPVALLEMNPTTTYVYQLIVLAIIGGLFIWFMHINSKNIAPPQRKYFAIIEFSLLIAYIPLLAFTSENAFIFTLPLVFIILLYFHDLRVYEKILAVIGFVFLGGNFGELWGPSLTHIFDNLSLISIGTIILIFLLYALRLRNVLKFDK